ncbi:MAG: hypothetical protein M3N43_07815 [Actinomycetota bacterium]|nr:hypothetical protein [Actinomycetota bacterium]
MTTPTGTLGAERTARCRMLDRHDNRCAAEALDPLGEALICARHAGAVLELVNRRTGRTGQ